jgi:GNAT superfamily N-acetyltransferase
VRTATGRDRADVARVLATAFDDDPLARWLVPHPQSLRRLFAAQARWIHGVPGCTDLALLDGEPVGAALWDPPGHRVPTWRQLASLPFYVAAMGRGLGRGVSLENAMHGARPSGTFWYLAGIGAVRRGEGIGSALLRHRLEQTSGSAYLESSKKENIPLYGRFGFELRETLELSDGPDLWPMWRAG